LYEGGCSVLRIATERDPLAGGWGLSLREARGIGVWLLVGLVIAIPEIWSLVGEPPWPTISAMLLYIEKTGSGAVILVTALALNTRVTLDVPRDVVNKEVRLSGGRTRLRTQNGRITNSPEYTQLIPFPIYASNALILIAASTIITAILSSSKWLLGFVIYGLIADFVVIIPWTLTLWFAREPPFPTFRFTLAAINRYSRLTGTIIWLGLAILIYHIVAYPWPSIALHLTTGSP
jgi:hypothetical protein